jgi:hypothetical protein
MKSASLAGWLKKKNELNSRRQNICASRSAPPRKKNQLEKKRMSSTLNKKGRISGYVKHIRWKTPQISGVL